MERDLNQLNITSFRGGVNLTDPPMFLPVDATVESVNMDFSESTLGALRNGAQSIPTVSENGDTVKVYRYTPTNDQTDAKLFAMFNNAGTAKAHLRDAVTGWGGPLPFVDAPTMTRGLLGETQAQNLHSRLFLAYPSSQDRLHVLDSGGSNIRRTGLAASALAPTVANTGSGSYAAILRYYRMRYTVQSGGVTIRRSEPSPSVSFTPSGSGTAARITKPATVSESETHWEIEASPDNANFYRIATVVVGTTTYDDSASVTTYAQNPLSADIGDYTLIPSGKYLAADDDRLLIAGSWSNETYASRVWWTPVGAADGIGNDERLELDSDPFLDLDGYEGGSITGLSRGVNGYIYAYKYGHVYRLVRTGNRAQAYVAVVISKSVGSFPNSNVSAFDENGNPADYFWDPQLGPQRIGANGVEDCGQDIRAIVATVNANASIPVIGFYYPNRKQVWFYIATGENATPNQKLVFQIRDGSRVGDGVRGGWGLHTGTSCSALSVTMFSRVAAYYFAKSNDMLPVFGLPSTGTCILGMADTTGLDMGATFTGKVLGRPASIAGLLRQTGATAATLVAPSLPDARVALSATRDYGEETFSTVVPLASTLPRVITPIDNFALSELRTLQVGLASDESTLDYSAAIHLAQSPTQGYLASPSSPVAFSSVYPAQATVGAWVRLSLIAPSTYGVIAFLGPGMAAGGFGIAVDSSLRPRGLLYGTTVTLTGSTLTSGVWHHIALRMDWTAGGLYSLWVDGTSVASSSAPIPAFTGNVFSIGAGYETDQDDVTTFFTGDIAHAFYVNRPLTDLEMVALASSKLAPNLLETATDLRNTISTLRYYPLQGAADLLSFDGKYPLIVPPPFFSQGITDATNPGLAIHRNPTAWAVDAVAVQQRDEERQ